MIRVLRLLAFALGAALATDAAPAIGFEEMPAPTSAVGARGPSLTASPDGAVWLTWLERDGGATALKCATLPADAKTWTPAQTIARGVDLLVNDADFPSLTVGVNGRATAVWSVNNPASAVAPAAHGHDGPGCHARISRTTDGGRTWSAPSPLTRESDAVEFVSVATLADGRVLAAWLDGRAKKKGGHAQQLFSRIVGGDGPDQLVDASVCDCCQTALTAFPDGTALLAYRGRTETEVRDIRATRFRAGEWDEPRPLNNDDWRIAGCPVNGPQLASDGGRVGVAWFTGADGDPRVLASFSPDAGTRFLLPLRLSEGKTSGRVATLLLHDGAILVAFVDGDGRPWLRRVTPDFAAGDAVPLAAAGAARVKGFPRLALARDYLGGKEPARVVVAFAQDGVAGLRTLRVTVPEAELLEAEKNCDCAPSADQLAGFPIRGSVVAAPPAGGVLRVRHFEVPGIFAEGEHEFGIDAGVAPGAEAGRQFLARIERRGATWRLFDIRWIASVPR